MSLRRGNARGFVDARLLGNRVIVFCFFSWDAGAFDTEILVV